MKIKLASLILFFLLIPNNTFTNNDENLNKENENTLSKKIDELKKINEISIEKDVESKKIIKELKLKSSFNLNAREKVRQIATDLNTTEENIYRLFYIECRGNHKAVNKQPGDHDNDSIRCETRATGLIGFMPATAKNLGTSTKDLYNMSIEEQLEYVHKYLQKQTKNKTCDSFLDLYLAVLYPHAINKSKDFILGSEKSLEIAKKIAKQNKGIDKKGNNDGLITVRDVESWLMSLS